MTAQPTGFVPDKSPDKITPGKALEPAGTTPQPQKDFQSYMQGTPNTPMPHAAGASGTAPTNIAKGTPLAQNLSMGGIQAQAKSMQDSLGTVGQQLKTANLKLRRSQAHLLKNKLTSAQDYTRQAGAKLGVETPEANIPAGSSPVDRFLAYVNSGQNQLIAVQEKLKQMSAKGEQLNAAEMLTITVKMNLASQEIEYSTTLLGKVIDSIKQIMNTQL